MLETTVLVNFSKINGVPGETTKILTLPMIKWTSRRPTHDIVGCGLSCGLSL